MSAETSGEPAGLPRYGGGKGSIGVRPPDESIAVVFLYTTLFAERQSFCITPELNSVKKLVGWAKLLNDTPLHAENPWHDPRFSIGHN